MCSKSETKAVLGHWNRRTERQTALENTSVGGAATWPAACSTGYVQNSCFWKTAVCQFVHRRGGICQNKMQIWQLAVWGWITQSQSTEGRSDPFRRLGSSIKMYLLSVPRASCRPHYSLSIAAHRWTKTTFTRNSVRTKPPLLACQETTKLQTFICHQNCLGSTSIENVFTFSEEQTTSWTSFHKTGWHLTLSPWRNNWELVSPAGE